MKPVVLGPISRDVDAPTALVYQMLTAIGQGAPGNGERSEVLQRAGDELVCDFWTQVSLPGGIDRLVRTRERVTLLPPDRVDYEHLDGPVRGLTESITLTTIEDGATRMTYLGAYEPRNLLDTVRAHVLVRPAMRRVMKQHFEDVRKRAEARAARSRAFRRDPFAEPR